MTAHFVSPPEPALFNARVWEIVQKIPSCQVATYGQIANLLAPPPGMDIPDYKAFGPRWVGGAMAACPAGIPWQRVVNAQGKISVRSGVETRQRVLLEAEGVEFDDRGRIDLARYGWHGPS